MKNRNKYQEKFSYKKAPIDKEQLWNQISTNKDFPKKERGNRGGLYFLSLLLIAILGIGIFQITDNKKAIDQLDQKMSISYTPPSTKKEVNNSSPDIKNSPTFQNKNQAQDLEKTAIAQSLNSIVKSTNQIDSHNNTNEQSTITVANNTSTSHTKSNNRNNNGNDSEAHSTTVENLNNPETQQTTLSEINLNSTTQTTNYSGPLSTNTLKTNTQSPDKIIGPDNLPIDLDLLFLDFRLAPDLNSAITIIPQPKNRNWILGLMGGSGIANHLIISLSDDDYITQTRKENVQNLKSQYASISVQRLLPKNFSISLEGELEHLYQRYDFSNSDTSLTRNEDSSAGFYSYTTTTIDYEKFHRYQFLNLNMLADKRFQVGALSLSIGAGIAYNLSFNLQGNVFDEAGNLAALGDLREYKSTTGLSYLGNIGLDLSLTDRIIFNTALRYKSPNALTDTNLSLDHKVHSWKLGVGLSYRL